MSELEEALFSSNQFEKVAKLRVAFSPLYFTPNAVHCPHPTPRPLDTFLDQVSPGDQDSLHVGVEVVSSILSHFGLSVSMRSPNCCRNVPIYPLGCNRPRRRRHKDSSMYDVIMKHKAEFDRLVSPGARPSCLGARPHLY